MEAPWMKATANNVKAMRLQLLLTPKQLADRLGVTTRRLRMLEQSDAPLTEEWAEAFAHALGVSVEAVVDPSTDIKKAAAAARERQTGERRLCRVAARYAIQAMVAKIGGLNVASSLAEEDLELALQNLLLYTENSSHPTASGHPAASGRPTAPGAADGTDEISRLSQSLQITVLAVLQSHGVDPERDLLRELEIARDGALSLIEAFSRADQPGLEPETK